MRAINVAHRHIVFTIPERLRDIIIFKDRSLIKVMMDCASKSALEVLQSKSSDLSACGHAQAGAVPGILAVVHTFGRDLKFHPHVHILMTEGGLTSKEKWDDIPFLPYNLLRKKWQYHLLTEIKKRIPKSKDNDILIDNLFKDNEKGLGVNGASKMTSSRYSARYIGRYVARPALAEYRITRYDGKEVTFWYESHETGKRVYKTLSAKEFIIRLIDHIPLKGFKMVRNGGLYARRIKSIAIEILKKCKKFIQSSFAFVTGVSNPLNWRERLKRSFGKDPLICSRCKEEMELWRIWHPEYGDIYNFSRDAPVVENEEDLSA